LLKSQGLQANQDVTFLTDGGEEIRALAELVTPESEHVLGRRFIRPDYISARPPLDTPEILMLSFLWRR
jgi:hypothetical protein